MIILLTGARDLPSPWPVYEDLNWLLAAHNANWPNKLFVVRHGACTTGADYAAKLWVDDHSPAGNLFTGYNNVQEDPMKAPWGVMGKAAGPWRNTQMVNKEPRPWFCLGYPLPHSRGSKDCLRKAGEAGIPYANMLNPEANERFRRWFEEG